jgi:hypothetical protein
VINNNRHVIGQLFGPGWCTPPNSRCANPQLVIGNYGKFSVSWTGGGTNATRLSNWLAPNNANITILNGIDACSTSNFTTPTVTTTQTVTGGNINVQNVTVTNGATLTIKAMCDINVQGVTVKNNSKLILDASGEVNIIKDFEVELGSEFEIKYP